MENNFSEIQEYQSKLKEDLIQERDLFGGYDSWYEQLEAFRKQMEKYVDFDNQHRVSCKKKKIVLENGHYVDHHAIGYFAPMDFRRIGFEGEKRTPAQQIGYLNEFLKKQGIRFIYVALPCKEAVYPEMVIDKSCIPFGGKVIPQWRKMLMELLSENVEIIDLYDLFLNMKDDIELYTKDHYISCLGAEIVGKKIASYIEKTTEWNRTDNIKLVQNLQYEYNGPEIQSDGMNAYFMKQKQQAYAVKLQTGTIMQPYVGIEKEYFSKSEISVFGNCNLCTYLYDGTGIHSNMAYYLQYPVRYAGRYLPFSPLAGERLANMPKSILRNNKILLEIGFPSGAFVRAPYEYESLWNLNLMNPNVFD